MFLRITFPLLKPMTVVILTMTLLWELKIFDIVIVGAGDSAGGVGHSADVLALQMYRYAFVAGDIARGATVAALLSALTFIATLAAIRYLVGKR